MKKIDQHTKLKWLQEVADAFNTLQKQQEAGPNKLRMATIKKIIEVIIEAEQKET